MSDERMNKHPEFLQETMFQEHGTRVLITNPQADAYLDAAREQRLAKENRIKEKFPQWEEGLEPEN